MSFEFEETPQINLSCMLVPVQHREYENGLHCIIRPYPKGKNYCFWRWSPAISCESFRAVIVTRNKTGFAKNYWL